MSVASSSIRFIKFSTSSSSACTCSSHSPSSSSTFRFSATKPTFVTIIRSSQTEGPLRRPVAPSPPTTPKPAPPSPPAAPPKPVAVVVDKSVITMEFQRQKAKELQEYFKQKKLDEADQGPFFGFIAKNEISNGRWAMFGFAVGMLTEYATGSDFVDQVKGVLKNSFSGNGRAGRRDFVTGGGGAVCDAVVFFLNRSTLSSSFCLFPFSVALELMKER